MPTIATPGADAFAGTEADYSGASEGVALNMFHQPTSADDWDDSLWAEDDTFASSVTTFILSGYNDFFFGDGRNGVTVYGGVGDDSLFAGSQTSDLLNGGDGDDNLFSGVGVDTMIGGAGRDTVSYRQAFTGITASLGDSTRSGEAVGDLYTSIEDLEGSAHDDVLYSVGDGGDHQLIGDPDVGHGLGGDDILHGARDDLEGYTNFIPGAGVDVLYGGGGLLENEGGNLIDYETAGPEGVTVDLSDPDNNTGDAEDDVYWHLQFNVTLPALDGLGRTNTGGHHTDIAGSMFQDILIGDAGHNKIFGDAGNDALYPVEAEYLNGDINPFRYANGSDQLYGGLGDDWLFGRAGADYLNGGAGTDLFVYELMSDSRATMSVRNQATQQLETLVGYDIIADFVTGVDVIWLGNASLRLRTTDIPVNAVTIQRVGDHGSFVFAGDLMIGVTTEVNGGDLWGITAGVTLLGTTHADALAGSQLGDTIQGDDGSDWITGGLGNDALTGGAGADTFVYLNQADSTTSSWDLITDFSSAAGDRINLSYIHATFGSATFSIGYAGGSSFIGVDLNNDSINDMMIQAVGTVSSGDVIW